MFIVMYTKRPERGVTLVEVLIYIFVFSVIVTGGIATAFWTYESTARTGRIALIESEADFVLRKLDWATTGATVTVPAEGNTGTVLMLVRDGNTYSFAVSAGHMTLTTNGGAPVPLSTDAIVVDAFEVMHVAAALGAPGAVSATISINGTTYGPKVQYTR